MQKTRQLLRAIAVFCFLAGIFPIGLASILGMPFSKVIALIGSTFALEFLAIPVGIELDLNWVYVLLEAISVGMGIFVLLLGLFEFLGSRSQKIVNLLLKLRWRMKRLEKYGVYGLIPGVFFLGVYGCAAIVWTSGWSVKRSTISTAIGYIIAATIVLLATLGVLRLT